MSQFASSVANGRRRLEEGGTFADYPEAFGEGAYAITQTVIFTLMFFVLAVLIGMQMCDRESLSSGKVNNRQLVIMCIFLGSGLRVIYIPVVDTLEWIPKWCIFVFRALKDILWFAAFSLLAFFWMEIQVATSRNTFTVEKFRKPLVGVIIFYAVFRSAQMTFEIADGDSKRENIMEFLVASYVCFVFIFGGYWAIQLRKRLKEMAKGSRHRERNAKLTAKVQQFTRFMILETIVLFFLTVMSGLGWYLNGEGLVSDKDTPNEALTIKVIQRLAEWSLIAVLWRMLFIKSAAKKKKRTGEGEKSSESMSRTNSFSMGSSDVPQASRSSLKPYSGKHITVVSIKGGKRVSKLKDKPLISTASAAGKVEGAPHPTGDRL